MERRRRLVAASILALAGGTSAPSASIAQPVDGRVARTDSGKVAGHLDGRVLAFLGLPYAATTAGANRWRAPQAPAAWRGIRQAAAFGPNCIQGPPYLPTGSPWTAEYLPVGPDSEDCLSLNVWTPRARTGARLPVMVWIHGGGFGGGSSSVPLYRGAALATRGIVVVTINYRVGVFGFLASPALTREGGTSGNYGLMDQVAALRWVRRNIAAFGGDPGRVTIAGQSAGAASVHDLLAAPDARGLFVCAIAESGSGMGIGEPPRAEAEAMGERLATAAVARDLAALRALPADKLLAAARDRSVAPPGPQFRPIRDGRFLPDPLVERTDVPVLTGMAADEASVGDPTWREADAAALRTLEGTRFGEAAPLFEPLYPTGAGSSPLEQARALLRDRGLAAMLDWNDARPRAAAPTFAYLWMHAEPGSERFGAFHSVELPYVFGALDAGDRPISPADRRLADISQRYWVNFIKTGDPNGPGLPAWPKFGNGMLLRLDETLAVSPALDPEKLRAYRAYARSGGRLSLF